MKDEHGCEYTMDLVLLWIYNGFIIIIVNIQGIIIIIIIYTALFKELGYSIWTTWEFITNDEQVIFGTT
jgi:hypothetical protein